MNKFDLAHKIKELGNQLMGRSEAFVSGAVNAYDFKNEFERLHAEREMYIQQLLKLVDRMKR